MAKQVAKRYRKQTDRYGDSGKNMDDMFDDIETTSNGRKDSNFVETDEQQSDISDSGSPTEKIPFNENGFQNAVQKQLARFEIKLTEIYSTVIQIHRSCISNVVSTQMESENVDELPLTSDASLNKFEQDLAEQSYRQKIVSDRNSNIF